MKERIKELIVSLEPDAFMTYKGYLYHSGDPKVLEHSNPEPLYTQQELVKFAELIVWECISINRQRMFSDYEGDSLRVAHNNALLCANSDMFEHFGVEEQVTEPAELHTCPYAEEIHGDYETLCDCDEEQQYQCRMDI